jgi:hypothetical protein
MRLIERRLRQFLRGPARSRVFSAAAQRASYLQAQWLVRTFYLATLVVAFKLAEEVFTTVNGSPLSDPLWPVFWLRWTDPIAATKVLVTALLIASALCVIVPESRAVRVFLALAFVETTAVRLSFGYFFHSYHIWLWLAVVFAAFPIDRDWRSALGDRPSRRHGSLSVFFFAQAMVALFYSLSGLWKALGGVFIPEGHISSFSPRALEMLVLGGWMQNAHETILQDMFQLALWIGWPTHVFVIYVELFMLIAVFRPEMHRPFGIVLMAFHLMVWMLMGIQFVFSPMTMALLFVFSPFASTSGSIWTDLRQAPLFGDMISVITGRVGVQGVRRGLMMSGIERSSSAQGSTVGGRSPRSVRF